MAAEDSAKHWYVARDGKQTGPISEAEIRAIAAHGYFRPSDLVWRPGFTEWRPALTVFPPVPQAPPPTFTAPATPAPAAARGAAPTGQGKDAAAPAGAPAGAAIAVTGPSGGPAVRPAPAGMPSAAGTSAGPGFGQAPVGQAPAGPAPVGQAPFGSMPASPGAPSARGMSRDLEARDLGGQPGGWPGPGGSTSGAAAFGGHPSGTPASGGGPAVAPLRPAVASPRAEPSRVDLPRGDALRFDRGRPEARSEIENPFVARPAPGPNPYQPAGPQPAPFQPFPQQSYAHRGAATASAAAPQPGQFRPLVPAPVAASVPSAVDMDDDIPVRPRTSRMAIAALAITLLAIAGGVLVAAEPAFLKGSTFEPVRRTVASIAAMIGSGDGPVAAIEQNLQATAHWPVIKREFPDWYGERLREVARLTSENKSPDEITRVLAERIVKLRRDNAAKALSASAPRLLAVANAFLDNLRQLKERSPQACYSFISQGELTPAALDLLATPGTPPPAIQLQVAAIFEAIGEGRRAPVVHDKPQKSDYDMLMDQLGKLGWKQSDISTFADPRALARTEPERVCQMVQDWFVAHIAIEDAATKQRLIGETLRPVVSG
jgi:hypothetical protein